MITDIKNIINSFKNGEVIFSHKIYPNPSSTISNISFEALTENSVSIKIYNLRGQLVWSDKTKATAGENTYQFNFQDRFGSNLSNGIYFLTIDDGKKIIKEKMTYIK